VFALQYDRGKVPFSAEWAACDLQQSAVRALHCLDRWLLTRCRADLLAAAPHSLGRAAVASSFAGSPSGGGGGGGGPSGKSSSSSSSSGFGAWLREVALAYPPLATALDAPSALETHPPRTAHSAPAGGALAGAATAAAAARGDGGGLPVNRPSSGRSGRSGSATAVHFRYYYVAACVYNSARLLQGGWADQIVLLATHLQGRGLPATTAGEAVEGMEGGGGGGGEEEEESGEEAKEGAQMWNRVFVSIYENDSKDGTPAELDKLKTRLDKLGVRSPRPPPPFPPPHTYTPTPTHTPLCWVR
jgi:hypothetical protein